MALYTIGDLHFSTGCDKPMDIFSGWKNYMERIILDWEAKVTEEDTVVLAGDISWGMNFKEALSDFELIDSLPGKKIIVKGNHDYWWNSRKKMEDFFLANGLNSIKILHNSCVEIEPYAICGTRGWVLEDTISGEGKITFREEGRLRASLELARKAGLMPIVFLHYPPVYGDLVSGKMIEIMKEYEVKQCYYGHLHGKSCSFAVEGKYLGIDFTLISADHLNFKLAKVF